MPSRQRSQSQLGTRPDIEEIFNKQEVKFEFWSSLPTTQFDIKRSLSNQTRIEPLDEDIVALYTEGVERGDKFPPVVAWRPGKTRNPPFIIIDGNHRLEAHRRAGQPIAVYEIAKDTPKQAVGILAIRLNGTHGLPMSEATRIRHALFLIGTGTSQEQAAALVNVKKSAVTRAVRIEKGERRARVTGVSREWEGLKAANSKSLLMGIKTDEGFGPAVTLAFQARLNWREVQELVNQVNGSTSGTKQGQTVATQRMKYSDRIAASGGGVLTTSGKRGMGPRARFITGLGQLAAIPEDPVGLARLFSEAEKQDMARRCLDQAKVLHKVAMELDPEISA